MTLEASIRINAAFSIATGILLVAAPGTVGGWLGISIDGWLRLLGLTLIGHGVLLLWASQQRSITSWARLNIAAIGPYPLIMIGLVMTGLVDTALGRTLLLIDGSIVGVLAFMQWNRLRAKTVDTHPVSA